MDDRRQPVRRDVAGKRRGLITLGLDLGSVRCGAAVVIDGRPCAAATIDVDPCDVGPAVQAIDRMLTEHGAERVALEWCARAFAPRDVTPQAAAKIIDAQRVMAVLRDRVHAVCNARCLPIEELNTATWRSHIGARKRRNEPSEEPHTWRTADAAVRAALVRHLGEELVATLLPTVDMRDAAGVALADYLGPKPAVHRVRAYRRRPGVQPRGSAIDHVVEAMAQHGRPIRLDVLAVRTSKYPALLRSTLIKAIKIGRVIKVSHGVYALPDMT